MEGDVLGGLPFNQYISIGRSASDGKAMGAYKFRNNYL